MHLKWRTSLAASEVVEQILRHPRKSRDSPIIHEVVEGDIAGAHREHNLIFLTRVIGTGGAVGEQARAE